MIELRGYEIVELDRLSYNRVRGGIALLALICPVVIVLLGCTVGPLRGSFSEYYYADYHCRFVGPADLEGCQLLANFLRDLFVGGLCAIGALLVHYKGYSRREDWTLTLAGVCVVGIALSPMQLTAEGLSVSGWPTAWHGQLHLICLTLFVLLVAYAAVVCSETTLQALADKRRQRRYRLAYRLIGAEMIAMPIIVVILSLTGDVSALRILLVLEILYIWSLAGFWLLKSREIADIELQGSHAADKSVGSTVPIDAYSEPAVTGVVVR